MDRISRISLANAYPRKTGSPLARETQEVVAQFQVRDITNRRLTGTFASESLALASLRGGPDGHFSVNNHQGEWCEVEVWGGARYVRYSLMVDGSPAEFTKLDVTG